ncbi:MAG: hypothetical protein QM765_49885 [Myxococcales bacterium]
MIIACPKCKQRHDVSQRKAGETFSCGCGNVLETPKKSGGLSWVVVLAIIAAGSVPCLGILAAIAIPNFIKFQLRSKASEAVINLSAIRTAEVAYQGEHERYVAAGPVPAQVPGKMKQEFVADDGFKALGWSPEGRVYYQYEVKVTGPKSVVVTARGDIDGDGKVAEYSVEISDGQPGSIQRPADGVY